MLLIEVADSSLDLDRRVKMPLYAAAGIAEVWLIDLANDAVEVYRDPDAPAQAGICSAAAVAVCLPPFCCRTCRWYFDEVLGAALD